MSALGRWLGTTVVLVLVAASMVWAFHRYVGADASRYFAVGAFPCPFHVSGAR